jgi:holin-like protein
MLVGITLLLLAQLLGEALTRGLGLGVPGPVVGLALMAAALLLAPRLRPVVDPAANSLLRHLSLLFVPAAVGIVQYLPLLRAEGLAIAASILLSTFAALVVTALVFRGVSKLMGIAPQQAAVPEEGA